MSRAARSSAIERAQRLHRRGESENRAGRHAQAAQLLVAAIEADPDVAEYHYELGRAMRALAEFARAVTCFRRAIEIDPAHVDAHIDLASVMLAIGDVDAAEQAARAAVALAPRSAPAQINLGMALEGQKNFAAAADCYRAGLAIESSVAGLACLASACLQLGALDEARRCAEEALRLAPLNPDLHARLGSVLLEQRLPEQAAERFREVLRLQPTSTLGCNNLGFAYDLQGRTEEAMQQYERALAIDPADVAAHLNRAASWLAQGDYARGWDEYEWRLRSAEYVPLYNRFGPSGWDGSPLAGRRVLVYAEQGLGDEVMYSSCLPDVLAQAAHCVIDCEPRLAGLMRRSFPRATVHAGKQTDPVDWLADAGPLDLKIPIGGLPRHLRRARGDFPEHAGYLRAAPERVEAWRERLAQLGAGPKIGLAWRGGVPQTGRGSRSITLQELLPVLQVPGAIFVNLQYRAADEIAAVKAQHGITIHHWQEAIDDYEEAAALLTALDRTVSVSTAVADLGGALGRPVWVMVPVRADFRYELKGERMPWYPSLRVFRQARYGEWPPVIEAVAAELSRLGA